MYNNIKVLKYIQIYILKLINHLIFYVWKNQYTLYKQITWYLILKNEFFI